MSGRSSKVPNTSDAEAPQVVTHINSNNGVNERSQTPWTSEMTTS